MCIMNLLFGSVGIEISISGLFLEQTICDSLGVIYLTKFYILFYYSYQYGFLNILKISTGTPQRPHLFVLYILHSINVEL